jgi:hypothetical protein
MLRLALPLLIFVAIFCQSCAYGLGYGNRKLPGGYNTIAIPVFANTTDEVGIEGYFTNSLIREFERSQVAKVSYKDQSPVFVEGVINQVSLVAVAQTAANQRSAELRYLPKNTVLDTGYRITVSIDLKLIKSSDKKVIWQQNFVNERVFAAAQISVPVLNTANPLYNQSAKHQNLVLLAQETMREAHDRLTERF